MFCEPDCRRQDILSQTGIEPGRRGNLQHLLIAALDAALALPQMGDATFQIAQNLHLDVARPGDELLDIDVLDPECSIRFTTAALVDLLQFIRFSDGAGATAATSGNRLDDHGTT